ncbi:hypothetical protein OSB04_013446, partial [Centaurea solstitialis]
MNTNGMIECSVCHSKLVKPSTKTVSRAYDQHRSKISKKQRALNVMLVVGDCMWMGSSNLAPSCQLLTEVAKVLCADYAYIQAARSNVILAVPHFSYAINNYLKFIMQVLLITNNGNRFSLSSNCKMLSNLKVLVIAVLLKIIMKRRFSIIQWEALALLLIGISINQMRYLPEGTTAMGLQVAMGAYVYTFIFVTVPSLASVFNEYALKSHYDTSIYLQNLFLYGYGAIFNFSGSLEPPLSKILTIYLFGPNLCDNICFSGPESFDILQGHSKATMLLIINNAGQGILSSFFFKYADTILKKYSSTVATIFTGFASAALFGHTLTINFLLGISIVFISMHQFFSPLSKVKEEENGVIELEPVQSNDRSRDSTFINMTAGANEGVKMSIGSDERRPLLSSLNPTV